MLPEGPRIWCGYSFVHSLSKLSIREALFTEGIRERKASEVQREMTVECNRLSRNVTGFSCQF